MTASDRPGYRPSEADDAPADEEYARTYAAGYEEGLRTALRELLGHASRGRTNQELRALIQSRLARLNEEVDLKRRSLLRSPRLHPFTELIHGAQPLEPFRGTLPSAPARGPPPVGPKETVLVRESRPERAIDLLRASRARFPRLVLVSLRPPDLGDPTIAPTTIAVQGPGGPGAPHLSPGEVAGQLRASFEAPGGALVYVDVLELFVTEEGAELTLKFARWLIEQAQLSGSALIASYDPRALASTDAGRLERLFGSVVDHTAPAGPQVL